MLTAINPRVALAVCAVLLRALSSSLSAAEARSPSDWVTAAPEEVGIDSVQLVEMLDFVRLRQIPVHSIQLVRRGRLVLDAYFYPYDGRTRHDVASVTKSITSTLIGLAVDRGHLRSVQQPLSELFPARTWVELDGRRRKQTIEHLLTMQSGWDCGLEPNEGRLAEMRRSTDWTRFMLNLPMVAEPGTRWMYCSGNCHVLSVLLKQAAGTNGLAFARHELFEPMGIRDLAWPSDSDGNNHGWGDLQMHPRDMAKIGQLFLRRGRWGERQILSERWVQQATRPHVAKTSNPDGYGYYWWVKGADYPGMFEAVGRGGQRINVWPAKELVIVFTGGGFEPGDLASFIVKAIKSEDALPANPNANDRLRQGLASALRSPQALPVPRLPAMAAQVSGKKYMLDSNQLELASLSLHFNASSEAMLQFQRHGQEMRCAVGLDGVERFSTNLLAELPFACKGRWLKADTFLLELDRVAGISLYRLRLTFGDQGNSVNIALSERSGLGTETFTGKAKL